MKALLKNACFTIGVITTGLVALFIIGTSVMDYLLP